MKNKDIIAILIAFIVFVILIFTTPHMTSENSSLIWIIFFLCILLLAIIWTIFKIKDTPKNQIIENYKKQPTIIKILQILVFITLIFETVMSQGYNMSVILVGILVLYEIFIKKED